MKVKIMYCHEAAKMPDQGTNGSAGYDLYAVEGMSIFPGDTVKVRTGLKSQFSKRIVAKIFDKSSRASKGIDVTAGVVDSDYRDEWLVVMTNKSREDFTIKVGDKIAQVLFLKLARVKLKEVNFLKESSRIGGFGSTDKPKE
jgi:dUTP pyrophosphatase